MTSDAKIGALAAKMEATEKRLDKIEEMEKRLMELELKAQRKQGPLHSPAHRRRSKNR